MHQVTKIALLAVGDAGWQGGIQYTTNLIHALNEAGDEQLKEIHLFRHSAQNFPDLHKFDRVKVMVHNTEEVFYPWSLANRAKWFVQRKFGNRINPRLENFFLNKGYDFVFPAMLSNSAGRLNAAAWIADFQYHHFPGGASPEVIQSARRVISQIATEADKIVLSSQFCEKDCLELFPASRGKTHVMPFAVFLDKALLQYSDFEAILQKYSLPRRFLLVANLFAPTKNHKTLFNALGILKDRGITINLVCTGNIVDYRNQDYANEILQMLTQNKIRAQVHLLGLIPRQDQVTLFRMATAMVQPSVNEGWNTGVEEGKALGKKIILSDIAVHKEQVPGNPYFFESLNAGDLADKIARLWKEEENNTFPGTEAEQEAFAAYQEKVKAFGKRFLEIARY